MKLTNRVLMLIAGIYSVLLALHLAARRLLGDRFWWLALLNTFTHLLFLPLLPLLVVAAALRNGRAVLRLLPLAIFGGIRLLPRLLPQRNPLPSGNVLQVATFNVWGTHVTPRIENWLRQQLADVLLLQEITPEYARETLAHLTDVYPYHSCYPETTHWSASMVLSRYPIIEQTNLEAPAEPDNPVLIRLVLDVDGQKIAVYNLQLAWPVRSRPRFLPVQDYYLKVILGYDDRLRNCQIDYLLNQFQNEPYPLIAAGDFNTSAASPTYQKLAAQLGDAFREAGRGWGGSWPVSTARGLPAFLPPLLRLDYIWHSAHFRALQAQVGPPLGSDHRPMLAALELLAD